MEKSKDMVIMDSAVRLFLANGYEETTIRMISKDTGLHIGSIYYVYESKEGLLCSLMEAFAGDILTKASRSVRQSGIGEDMAVQPPAYMIEACSRSRLLARLVSEAFRHGPVLDIVSSMAAEWARRNLPDERWTPAMVRFLYAGMASLAAGLHDGDVTREDALSVLLSYMPALTGTLPDGTESRILALMDGVDVGFMGHPAESIDPTFGDD